MKRLSLLFIQAGMSFLLFWILVACSSTNQSSSPVKSTNQSSSPVKSTNQSSSPVKKEFIHKPSQFQFTELSEREKLKTELETEKKILPNVFCKLPDGSIFHKNTGLIWQTKGSEKRFNWNGAKSYCRGLAAHGKSDWRLPSRDELNSLLTKEKKNYRYIDPIFPDAKPYYWSATTNASDGDEAWLVFFRYGSGSWGDRTSSGYVRCVSRP